MELGGDSEPPLSLRSILPQGQGAEFVVPTVKQGPSCQPR